VWTEQYVPAMRGHWLTGQGPDLPPSIRWQHSESLYLTLALRGGLGLIVIYGALTLSALLAARDVRDGRALRYVWLALAVMQVVEGYLIQSGPPQLLWTVTALVLGRTAADATSGVRVQGERGERRGSATPDHMAPV
jgi:hypothetical protein